MATREIRGDTAEVKSANEISILDFAEKEGYEIIDVDEKTVSLVNYEDILINRESNSWKVKDTEEHGNTIRFVTRMRDIQWKEAMDYLNSLKNKYLTAKQYNQAYDKQLQEEKVIEKKSNDKEGLEEQHQTSSESLTDAINNDDIKNNDTRNTTQKVIEQESIESNPIKTYSKEQMNEILIGIKKRLDTKVYNNIELHPNQMKEIRLGLEQGLDVSKYNYTHLSSKQMKEVRLGLKKGVIVNLFQENTAVKIIFQADQLKEIRKGMEKNLEVNIYANKDLSALQMRQIRIGLQDGFDVSSYASTYFSHEQMSAMRKQMLVQRIVDQIRESFKELFEYLSNAIRTNLYKQDKNLATQKGINEVNTMVNEKLNEITSSLVESIENNFTEKELTYDEKVEVISNSLKDLKSQIRLLETKLKENPVNEINPVNLNIKTYRDMDVFNAEQLKVIEQGISKDINVSIYAKPEYNHNQMQELLQGIEKGIDVSKYADPHFNTIQMNIIGTGLESGLNVSNFAKPEISWSDMAKIRNAMQLENVINADAEEIVLNEEISIEME